MFLCYSDWLLEVMWFFQTNQIALIQHGIDMLRWKIIYDIGSGSPVFSFFTDRRQKILKLIFRKSRWWISVEKNNLRFVAKWNKSIGVIKKRAGWGRFNKTFSVLQLTSCKFAIELFLVEVREVDLRWNCSFGYSNIWSFTSSCVFERITN